VSSVINGRSRVSAATTARINAAIEELGYQINPTARMLRSGRTGAIGLVVPELNRPYFGQLATLIADELAATGRHLVVQRSGGSREQELAAASFARLRMYDGVIFSVVDLDAQELERLGFSTPVVLIGERSAEHRFDHVAMDNVGGSAQATRHLLERGARRIVLLGGDVHSGIDMTQLRTRGYISALAERGLAVDEDLVVPLGVFDLEAGRSAVHSLAERGVEFDAVFAVTDVVALGALRGLAERGLRAPQDVQVIGFDNITEAAYSTPALTTVDPNKRDIARTALALLDERLNPDTAEIAPREITVDASLVVRESTLP
jgi:DNA-binding LacI/PurR family transcriptional regulator